MRFKPGIINVLKKYIGERIIEIKMGENIPSPPPPVQIFFFPSPIIVLIRAQIFFPPPQPSLSPAAGLLLPLHAAPISLSRSSLASAFAPFALSLSRAPFCAVPLSPLPELVHSRLRVHRRSDRGFLLQLSAHLPPLLDFLPPCRAPASPPWSTPLHPAPAPRAHHSIGFFFPLLPTAPLSCLLCSPRALLPASFLLGAHLPELAPVVNLEE
jgi:hypothetical protein